MPPSIDARLAELGITLPEVAAPAANYVPFVAVGGIVYISGQVSRDAAGGLIKGKLGDGTAPEAGAAAARTCALALIAVLKTACDGDLDRVKRVVKLTGFVNSAPDFTDQPKVVNGASDLMVEVFGEKGRHARSAVGMAGLPLGVAVEVEGVFEIA
jgi:enamine deaminase RidA (YjgF/YER057c/UK114 family)